MTYKKAQISDGSFSEQLFGQDKKYFDNIQFDSDGRYLVFHH